MRDKINFSVVDSEEKYKALQDFAKSFDHGGNMELPVVTINRGPYMIGYYQQILHPIIVPSFHPKMTTPRDFYESMNVITGAQHLRSMSPAYPNGICFTGTRNKNIERSNFEKIGYHKLDLELWVNVGGKQ